MGDKDGKTEKPTPKRIRDSRKRGEVAKSPDVVAAVALFVFAMLFVPLCEFSINHFSPYFVNYLEMLANPDQMIGSLGKIAFQAILMIFIMTRCIFSRRRTVKPFSSSVNGPENFTWN